MEAGVIAGLILGFAVATLAEVVTVTTYYPSPRGVYENLRTTGQTTLAEQGGNVGVGTASPTSLLHLSKAGPADLTLANSANAVTGRIFVDSGTMRLGTTTNHNLSFTTNNIGDRLIITTAGNVGIGETGPNQRLHVTAGNIKTEGVGGAGGEVHIYNTAGAGAVLTKLLSKSTGFGVDVSGTERLTVSTGGNVGIGTTSPTQALDVNGAVRIQGGSPAAGKVLKAVDGSGTATWDYATYAP